MSRESPFVSALLDAAQQGALHRAGPADALDVLEALLVGRGTGGGALRDAGVTSVPRNAGVEPNPIERIQRDAKLAFFQASKIRRERFGLEPRTPMPFPSRFTTAHLALACLQDVYVIAALTGLGIDVEALQQVVCEAWIADPMEIEAGAIGSESPAQTALRRGDTVIAHLRRTGDPAAVVLADQLRDELLGMATHEPHVQESGFARANRMMETIELTRALAIAHGFEDLAAG